MVLRHRLSAIAVFLTVLLLAPLPMAQPSSATEWHTGQLKLASTVVAQATVMTPQTALERLFTTKDLQEDWFASPFLTQIPLAQVQLIVTGIKAELGAYQAVQPDGANWRVVFEQGFVPTQIVLDDKGQITGLLFQPPRLNVSGLNELVERFKQLPGQVSLLVLEGEQEKVAFNPDLPLGVGSAFKLVVLEALRSQIDAGKKHWRDGVELQPAWKSLPSGFLQTWPDGSWLTLQTLAALMISQSDNTATDSLMHLVGRDAVEAISPRNRPFLTTRELFVLKTNPTLLQQYRKGTEATRRSLLTEVAKAPLPSVDAYMKSPVALDVEWFISTRELCTLMAQLRDLPLMRINPGVANPDDWQQVAFKGGSELGVLNMTTHLKAKSGQQYCVVATWNHPDRLDENRFTVLYGSLLDMLQAQVSASLP